MDIVARFRYGPGVAVNSLPTESTTQVARLVAGSLQALGPAAPMARTWNQYCVPLVSPVTAQLDALPT
jgi:hypothetical protein